MYIGMPRRYAYLNAKIRAMISKMLSAGDYEKMLQADTFEESARILATSTTGSELAEVLTKPKVDLFEVDQALTSVLVKAFNMICRYAPKQARQFLETYIKRIDMDSLKTIIRAVHNKVHKEEVLRFIVTTSEKKRIEFGRLLDALSVSQLIEDVQERMLRDTLTNALPLYESTHSTVPLEAALDRLLYGLLWVQIEKRLRKMDKAHAEELVGTRVDLSNMLIALRSKELNLSSSTLEMLMIPVYYKLRLGYDEIAKARNVTEVLNILSSSTYRETVQQAREAYEKDPDVTQIESLAERYVAHQSFKEFVGYSFHIGIALAYLNLKFYELRNIKATIIGKYENIPIQKIRNVLIFF